MANSTSPTPIAHTSFTLYRTTPVDDQFAEQNAAGEVAGIGIRYERGLSPSTYDAAKDTGANAYIMAVAAVITFTSAAQL
jgi:hypothetical protein